MLKAITTQSNRVILSENDLRSFEKSLSMSLERIASALGRITSGLTVALGEIITDFLNSECD